MFRDIDADCYIMVDGDDTYPAEDAVKVAQLVLDGKAEMAIGDRLSSTYFTENKRPFHNLGNRMVRGLINFIFNSNVKDIMTGCRAFSRRFVKSFPVLSAGFEIETEMTVHALDKNLAIREIPISYRDRMEGSVSKLNTFSDGFKVLITISACSANISRFSFWVVRADPRPICSGAFPPGFDLLFPHRTSAAFPHFDCFLLQRGLCAPLIQLWIDPGFHPGKASPAF